MSKLKEAVRERSSTREDVGRTESSEVTVRPSKDLRAVWSIMEKVAKRYRRRTGRDLSLSEVVLDLKNGH